MTPSQLAPGDRAPGFALIDSTGSTVHLSDFAGTRTVVYFYPAAFSPGCTTEACDFRDNLASLLSAGYAVVGISADASSRLAEFSAAEHLTYPLLSDNNSDAAKAWGAWGPKVVNGHDLVGALRSTFVIDQDGAVLHAHYNVSATGHVAALRGELGI